MLNIQSQIPTKRKQRYYPTDRPNISLGPSPLPSKVFCFDDYSNADAMKKFRFIKSDITRVAHYLGLPFTITTMERTTCDQVEGLYIVLRRLVVPDLWSNLVEALDS